MKTTLMLLALCLIGVSGCSPAISGGIDNATYNPSTGDIGGSVNFDVEFRETAPNSGKFIKVLIPKKAIEAK